MAVLGFVCAVAVLAAVYLKRKYSVTWSDVRNLSLLKTVVRRVLLGKTSLADHPMAQLLERRQGLPVVRTWKQLRTLGAAGVVGHAYVEGDALTGLLQRDAERSEYEDLVNMSAEEEAKLAELGVPARDLVVLRHTCPCGREMNAYDLLRSAAKTHGVSFLRMFLKGGSIVNIGSRPKIPVTCSSCGGVRELSHRYQNGQYHCYKCFGVGNTVRLEDGREITMGELRVGDRVQTPGGQYQPVFHVVKEEQPVPMVRIHFEHEGGVGSLDLTEHHLLYVGEDQSLVMANMVLTGDVVWVESPAEAEEKMSAPPRAARVTKVDMVESAPVSVFVPSAHVVASGVRASCFTSNTIKLAPCLAVYTVLHALYMPAWVVAAVTDAIYGVSKRVRH